MDQLPQSRDLEEVEHAIYNRFRLLRFAPSLERQFEADVQVDRCKSIIKLNYIGLMIYHCFLYGDYHAVGDAFNLDLFVHFGVMTPLMIAINIVLARHPPVWLREGFETLGIIVLTLTIVMVVAASKSPVRDLVQFTIVLVILFATVMQRMRFWYMVVACLSAQVLYSIGVCEFLPFSPDRALMSNLVFTGILLFSLVGCYNLEHEMRMGYLLRLRDRISNRELEAISRRDALTGVGNRWALDAAFLRSPRDSGIGKTASTAVLLLDIDHFKAFNDRNGHQEGDACLKSVAALIAGVLRDGSQAVYRFGGEEFLILLDDTAIDDALIVAERIRTTVARAMIPRDPIAGTFVTVSIGAAAGSLGSGATPATLIAAADSELYTAKRNGRDQVWPPSKRESNPASRSSEIRVVGSQA